MPTLEFTLATVPLRLVSASPELAALLADYFRYYQPRQTSHLTVDSLCLQPATAPLSLTLNLCQTLPARETLIAPTATLFSHTGVIRLWRTAADETVGADYPVAEADAARFQISNLKSVHSPAAVPLVDASALPSERFYFEMGEAAFLLEPEAGRATGYLTRAALAYPRIVANTYTLLPLLLLLRTRSVYHLHAAAVLTPQGKLCLIPAAPRAGKTTLATALGLAGWQPISDDSLLLEAQQASPNLMPLRKEFHLDEQLLARWPGLARAAVRHRYLGRACVEALEFFDTVELAEQRYSQIDYIIVPQISGEARSRLESLPASEALLILAEQSMLLQLWRDHTAHHFAALAALIQPAVAYRLWCGTDILQDPFAAAAVIQSSAT